MMPLNFTLTYNDGTNDATDVTGDIARVGTWGPMWFEPVFTDGARLVSSDGATCPRLFPAYIENGVLKTEAGGATDIRLWANDPAWNLARFQYRVRASLSDAQGIAIPWAPFCFDAPSVDIVKPLKLEMPAPGQKFGRGRPGFGLQDATVNSDQLMVPLRDDGITLPPVAIPESNAVAAAYVLTFGAR